MCKSTKQPNVVYVFADQWRGHAFGYANDPNVQTPHIDRFAGEAVNFRSAVSSIPVCGPARATLISGQRPLTHGVFLNDVCLPHTTRSIADRYKAAGYATAYIGKWHIDGNGRESFIPPERQRGFEHWKVCECSHAYWQSPYFEGADDTKRYWSGYDAEAQTTDACAYIHQAFGRKEPFLLMLAWGPPHNPYQTAPQSFRDLYSPGSIRLPPNVPEEARQWAAKELAGYYAHCTALDAQFGRIREALHSAGIEDNTILVFTSDHGDMLGSQGVRRKQWPWEESIRIPFLLRWPAGLGDKGRDTNALIDVIDHQPTLLDLCGITPDGDLEGRSLADVAHGTAAADPDEAVVLTCVQPFGEFARAKGGCEYRGLRTVTHTYVETHAGVWLLYDNEKDPWQLRNLATDPEYAALRSDLSRRLHALLRQRGDAFEPGEAYCRRWGYVLDGTGTVAHSDA